MIEWIVPPAMAVMNRWRGAATKYKKYFPRPLPQIALSVPFAWVAYNNAAIDMAPYAVAGIVLILTTLAWLTGWGRFMSLKEPLRGDKETTEFLIIWLLPYVSPYWYKVIGMAVRGMLITLSAGIATLNPLLTVSGAVMALGYMIGWMIYPNGSGNGPKHLNEATAIGELLAALFIGMALLFLY